MFGGGNLCEVMMILWKTIVLLMMMMMMMMMMNTSHSVVMVSSKGQELEDCCFSAFCRTKQEPYKTLQHASKSSEVPSALGGDDPMILMQ